MYQHSHSVKSNFTHQFDHQFLLLEDLNLGNRSLTNDLERVLPLLAIKYTKKKILDCVVIYKDSEGLWDGLIVKEDGMGIMRHEVYPIQEKDLDQAKVKAKAFIKALSAAK